MWKTYSALQALRMSSAVNRWIYYAQRLPLVGGRIPDAVYADAGLKQVVTVFAWIANVLWGLGTKFAYLGLLVYAPTLPELSGLTSDAERLTLFLHIFLLLSFATAGVSSAVVLEPKREKYVAVKLMRMLPEAYMRTTLSHRYIAYFVYYVPALALFLSLLRAPLWLAPALAVSLTLWRVFCEYAHLRLFEATGKVLIKENAAVWLTILLGYAAAYAPLFLEAMPLFGAALRQWPTLLALAALGVYAAAFLARYGDYRAAVDAATKRDDPLLNLGQLMADAQKTSVAAKDSDYGDAARQAGRFERLEGYDYLNAIFFARHRSLFVKPVYKRLAILAGVGAFGVLLAAFGNEAVAGFLAAPATSLLRFLPIAMSLLSIGEPACRAMFYHCDQSLLRYSFYRRAANRHFRIRLVRIAGLNLAIGAAAAAALTAPALAAGRSSASELTWVWTSALALSVFFSVHHLFMYYIFQPYSTELNAKNPFYWVVNMGVSGATGAAIFLEAPPAVFAWTAPALTFVYAAAAFALVRRLARHTLQVK